MGQVEMFYFTFQNVIIFASTVTVIQQTSLPSVVVIFKYLTIRSHEL